ncbi:MAG: EFR1 family ferrodoxin [Spirochaetes bacterium]|nr:EFR1 family ferrodoxin [Spirochaetota bacterium]MBU1081506.1 EFR1 family ferrodoxin [Spirochaetota bacterium]
MSRIVIAVFSGTGNARRAARIVSGELGKSGKGVELVDLAAGEAVPALGEGDLLVVCSSTLGFSPPSTVMDRIRSAPRSNGAYAAYISVCGATGAKDRIMRGWSGAASMIAFSALSRKGFEPVGSADVSYPENWTQVSQAAVGEARAAMLESGDAEALGFARSIAANDRVFVRRNLATRSLGRFIGLVFRLLARRMLGRLYIADDACTGCGLCAEACPSSAIAMKDGSPSWTADCSACNRCINACPAASIQTSTARLAIFAVVNVAAIVASAPAARAVLGGLAPTLSGIGLRAAAFVLGVALYAAFTALQIGPMDALVQAMERSPRLRRFFTASFTKRFTRYLAPGFEPGAK